MYKVIDILPLYSWIDLSNMNKPGGIEQSKAIKLSKAGLVDIDQQKHIDHSKIIDMNRDRPGLGDMQSTGSVDQIRPE